jgi:hypothetical protein
MGVASVGDPIAHGPITSEKYGNRHSQDDDRQRNIRDCKYPGTSTHGFVLGSIHLWRCGIGLRHAPHFSHDS